MERGKIKSFRDLIVWQKSYDLCLKTYEATSAHEVELMLAALMRSLKRKIAGDKTNSTI